jgi:predicted acyltransferase
MIYYAPPKTVHGFGSIPYDHLFHDYCYIPGNYATTFSPLLHAQWHGFTPTDLVFPSFLLAVGNALSFVMLKWQSLSQSQVLYKIFKRSLLIFLLGT